MFPDGPVALAEIASRLEHLLAGSTAEATEISWLEFRRGQLLSALDSEAASLGSRCSVMARSVAVMPAGGLRSGRPS